MHLEQSAIAAWTVFPAPLQSHQTYFWFENSAGYAHNAWVIVTVYHGSADKLPMLREGAFVTTMLPRAAKHARYPNDGEGREIGYIFELAVDEADVEWDTQRDNISQGRLRRQILAQKIAVSNQTLDFRARENPVQMKPDNSWVWSNGDPIDWRRVKRLEPQTVPTDILVSVARDQVASGELEDAILRELQVRFAFENCPAEDKALISELDRSVFMPAYGTTKLLPGVRRAKGSKPRPIPPYYQKPGVRILTNLDTQGPKSDRAVQQQERQRPKKNEREDDALTSISKMGWNPAEILRAAIKAVPAMKYGLAALGLVAIVALVQASKLSHETAIYGSLITFAVMILVLVFAKMASKASKILFLPFAILVWAIVLIAIGLLIVLFTAAVFQVPVGIAHRLFPP